MATLKYISGTLGDKHEGAFTENRTPDQSSLARNTDYLVMENINLIGNLIIITRVNNTGEANKDLKKLKPILGLGLRDAFRKAAANTKNHSARLDRDIASLTQLEASELTNASGAAILSIAGIALMGPWAH